MSSNERIQDVSFLLFVVPFALSLFYGLYLWAEVGFSWSLPQPVFLQVAESPYIFLAAFVAVMAGVTLDVTSEPLPKRRQKLAVESGRLQVFAVVFLVLSGLAAWYAAGFDVGGGFSNLLAGRYPIILPVLAIAVSFLMLPAVSLRKGSANYVLAIACGLGSLAVVDEVGKRNYFAGLALGAALAFIAIYLYIYGLGGSKDSTTPAERSAKS
ncbi:MAG: hypothetical protein OK456_05520 [Thaumarchaeota archaeon]|nr:hypothetical protein [Nitrososphaerota archaeon]